MAKALTVRSIEQAKADPKRRRREIPDGLLPGLYFIVQPSGAKSWAIRYRVHGRPQKYTLGSWPKIDLSTARELGGRALRSVAEGGDPALEKRQARRTEFGMGDRDLFENVFQLYLSKFVRRTYRPRSIEQCEMLVTNYVLPRWSGRPIQDIAKRDVLDLMDSIVDRGAGITANRTFAAIRRMFNWCIERAIVSASPCVGVKAPFAEKSRDRILADEELRWLWRACDASGFPFGPMIKLLVLTGQRRMEVCELPRSEIDFEKNLWTIPRARAKNNRTHEVPLSEQAIGIIRELPLIGGRSGLLFTTDGKVACSGFSFGKRCLDKLILFEARREAQDRGEDPAVVNIRPWVLHDLRRTTASGMARLGVDLPVIEKVLNHVSGSFGGIAGVYQRHSFAAEKRAALQAWSNFVTTTVTGKCAENVIALPPKQTRPR